MKLKAVLFLVIAGLIFTVNCKKEIKGRVFFEEPKNNAEVTSPVQVKMGVEGRIVKPAGEVKDDEGHHHIVIDGNAISKGKVIADEAKHYGKGQTETELELEPGEHTLTLQFADGLHRSYGPAWSETITITVKDAKEK